AEMDAAYLYLAMSAQFASTGLKGAANWLNIQAKEEMTHAEKFYNYVLSQGKRVELQTIDAPPGDFGTLLEAFKTVLEHEQKVTSLINDLVYLASDEKDKATEIFLHWFVTEQVEEEENAQELVDKLTLAGDNVQALFMLDKDLAERVFVPPAAGE
ncbi:ferritin, partial [bacterium B17]